MPAFSQLPLGRRIPDRLHAVSCSLPTMKDIIGYEEKNADTLSQMTSGYPRFVVHPLLRDLQSDWARRFNLRGQTLWATASPAMARSLAARMQPNPCRLIEDSGIAAVAHADVPALNQKARSFLQHVGGFLSSRQAEDYLVSIGTRERIEPETTASQTPETTIRETIADLLGLEDPAPICLTNSGMNAIYAAFRAVSEIQARHGRTIWIQIGWLYLDTIAILREFTGAAENYRMVPDVFDLGRLKSVLEDCGHRVAGIMIEAPTNPLVQTPDLEAIRALADKHGALLVVDPSIVSPANVDVLRFSDILVNSLTKYAAASGDVIAGAAVTHPASRFAPELTRIVRENAETLYNRDAARLAHEIQDYRAVVEAINENTRKLATFLEKHPAVRRVFWALEKQSAGNYLKIARNHDSVGCMITIELRGTLPEFYDRLPLPKGPSFGIRTTLVSPFMYMAHYELAGNPTGREQLQSLGIDPDLVRISVGTEPIEDIVGAFAAALG